MSSLINEKFKHLISDDDAIKSIYEHVTRDKARCSSKQGFTVKSSKKYIVRVNKVNKLK